MTVPTREQLLDEGQKQARIHGVDPACAPLYAEGWVAAARLAIEQASQPLKTVQLFGYGYEWRDPRDGSTHLLDPRDVTVILPSTRHMDDFDLHNSLQLAEARIEELKKQLEECKASLSTGAVQVVVRCDIDDARAMLGRFISITAPGLGVDEGLLSGATDLGGGAVSLRLECDGDAYRFFRSLRGEGYGFNFAPDTGLTLTPIPAHPSDVEP